MSNLSSWPGAWLIKFSHHSLLLEVQNLLHMEDPDFMVACSRESHPWRDRLALCDVQERARLTIACHTRSRYNEHTCFRLVLVIAKTFRSHGEIVAFLHA